MGNFACRCASLGCPDCVDVEPCVWWQLRRPGAQTPESSRQDGRGRAFAHARAKRTARPPGVPAPRLRVSPRGAVRTRLRRVAAMRKVQLAVVAPSRAVKKEKQQQIYSQNPCRPAARRRPMRPNAASTSRRTRSSLRDVHGGSGAARTERPSPSPSKTRSQTASPSWRINAETQAVTASQIRGDAPCEASAASEAAHR